MWRSTPCTNSSLLSPARAYVVHRSGPVNLKLYTHLLQLHTSALAPLSLMPFHCRLPPPATASALLAYAAFSVCYLPLIAARVLANRRTVSDSGELIEPASRKETSSDKIFAVRRCIVAHNRQSSEVKYLRRNCRTRTQRFRHPSVQPFVRTFVHLTTSGGRYIWRRAAGQVHCPPPVSSSISSSHHLSCHRLYPFATRPANSNWHWQVNPLARVAF